MKTLQNYTVPENFHLRRLGNSKSKWNFHFFAQPISRASFPGVVHKSSTKVPLERVPREDRRRPGAVSRFPGDVHTSGRKVPLWWSSCPRNSYIE